VPKRRSFDLMETSKRLAGRMKRRNEKKFNQTKKPRLMTGELPSLHQSSAELSSDHRSASFRWWCGAGAAGDGSFRRIRFPIQTHLPPPRQLALKIVNQVDEINADRGQHTKREKWSRRRATGRPIGPDGRGPSIEPNWGPSPKGVANKSQKEKKGREMRR
jgi:hypothetical protein